MFLEEKNQKRDGVTYRIFQNGVIQSQKSQGACPKRYLIMVSCIIIGV